MTSTDTLTKPLINPADLPDEIRRVARDRSDFRLGDGKQCRYEEDGQPACLIGVALYYLGVPIDVLRRLDCATNSGMSTNINSNDAAVILGLGDTFDELPLDDRIALNFASKAQQEQDRGAEWGVAVEIAEESL